MLQTNLYQLVCIDANGVTHTFYWAVWAHVDGGWSFSVFEHYDISLSSESCDLQLVPAPDDRLRIDTIDNYGYDWAVGTGWSDALIALASRMFGKTIVSSTNTGQKYAENEVRSQPADKMWKRQVDAGLAVYDSAEDRYIYPIANKSLDNLRIEREKLGRTRP